MKWTLLDVKQETDHPFLNFFTLTYKIDNGSENFTYDYYIASRKRKEELVAKRGIGQNYDGVLIPLYKIDENGDISFLLIKQFRPAVNNYLYSFVAGLKEKGEDLLTTAKRECLKECGAIISHLEIISPPSPNASGLSDELSAVVVGQIDSFVEPNCEEGEDIVYYLKTIKECEELLSNPEVLFPSNIRILLMYLIEKFKNRR